MAVAGPIIGAAQSDSGIKECMSLEDLALRLCHRLRLWRESRRRWRRDANPTAATSANGSTSTMWTGSAPST